MLELDFSKKDSLFSIKENYGSILHRHSTSHSARVRYSFLFPVLFSSAGTADPYIDASRLRGEKILFLSALHVRIGEEKKKYLHSTRSKAHHTHTRALAQNQLLQHTQRTAGFHFQPCTIVQLLSAGHHSPSSLTKKEGTKNLGS